MAGITKLYLLTFFNNADFEHYEDDQGRRYIKVFSDLRVQDSGSPHYRSVRIRDDGSLFLDFMLLNDDEVEIIRPSEDVVSHFHNFRKPMLGHGTDPYNLCVEKVGGIAPRQFFCCVVYMGHVIIF